MPEGSSHCPILGQAHVWTPALWGSGAKSVRAREAPRPGCLPLCGSHLSNQWLQIAPQPSARPPCSACTSHSPATPGTCRDAPKSDPPTRALLCPGARATTRARVVPARILPDIPRPRAASSTPRRGEAEEAKPASRQGPSRCKARDGEPQSVDRPLQPGVPRLAPGLPRRSGHCSVRVRGKCGLPGPEQTRRGAQRPRRPGLSPWRLLLSSRHNKLKFPQVQPAETAPHTDLGRAVESAAASRVPLALLGPFTPVALGRSVGWIVVFGSWSRRSG